MISSLQWKWRRLKRGKPGARFQSAYRRARRERRKTSPWLRLLRIAAAIVALAGGVALSVLPGPAFVFFGLAGVLFAMESPRVARGLDWLELRLRRCGVWGKRRWQSLPPAGRSWIMALGAGGSVVAMALAAWILFLR